MYLFVKKTFLYSILFHWSQDICCLQLFFFFFKSFCYWCLQLSPWILLLTYFILIVYQFNCYLYSVPIICLNFCHRITVFFLYLSCLYWLQLFFPNFNCLSFFLIFSARSITRTWKSYYFFHYILWLYASPEICKIELIPSFMTLTF